MEAEDKARRKVVVPYSMPIECEYYYLFESQEEIDRFKREVIESQLQALKEELGKTIEDALSGYRLQYQELPSGGGLNLVDALTPNGEETIKLGKRETELLADHLYTNLITNLEDK